MLASTTTAKVLKVFQAHRTSFITEHDLEKLSKLGVRHVRVPLSWCLTDHDPDAEITRLGASATTTAERELLDKFTCPDPFYPGVSWPAVPRPLVSRFLRSCAAFDITASLDVHTYPGATSPGTFSGLWPRQPRFWFHDDPPPSSSNNQTATDIGRTLFRDFVSWVEGLDDLALKGVLGIGPMNEPAHLAGVYAAFRDFLPSLPADLEESYLRELNHDAAFHVPKGPHLRVLLWLKDAVDVFRESKLPKLGKQLHVNLHESVLRPDVVESTYTDDDDAAEVPDEETRSSLASIKILAAWWNRTTHPHERRDWAALDVHHYHAWSSACSGAVDGPPSGNYSCGDVAGRDAALTRCAEWAPQVFRAAVDEMCGPGALLMSGEFSASTHHSVLHACNDIDTLKASYELQMQAAREANVYMYYWSYKMPHGGAFRSAWSFTQLMYLLGVTDRPDQESIGCGGHIPHVGEVTDDFFPVGGPSN